MKQCCVVCCLILLADAIALRPSLAQGNGTQPLRVLFIGNSYIFVNNMPLIVEQLSRAGKVARPLQSQMAVVGSATLEQHWNRAETQKALSSHPWDYVALQEQSTRPLHNQELFIRFSALFCAAIDKAGARPLFFLTWARKAEPKNQTPLTLAYHQAAAQSGAYLAPVGEAWKSVREHHPELELFQPDGSHPSMAGAYLSACVFYATLYKKSPIGLPGHLETTVGEKTLVLTDLSNNDAAILQEAAWTTVTATNAFQPVPKATTRP
jgi:hypothetical protein